MSGGFAHTTTRRQLHLQNFLCVRSVDPAVDEDPNRIVMNIGEVKILRIEG